MASDKDNAPDPFDGSDFADLVQGFAQLATVTRAAYTSYKEAGFTEEQGMALTLQAAQVLLLNALQGGSNE